MAFQAFRHASLNVLKDGGCSTSFVKAMFWWFGGWTGWGGTTPMSPIAFIRRGIKVETVINRLTFDGSTRDPMKQAVRDALIAFMAATAEAQAEVIKEAQRAGIAHARENDDGTKYRGRKPSFSPIQFQLVQNLLNQGMGISAIAKAAGVKRQSVYRIRTHPERQLAALASWYPVEAAREAA
jgi:DNA invertase Pin-like site-specific DNA recombinase